MTLESRPTSTVTWAEGPAEYLTLEPNAAKKAVGWDGQGFEIPAGEHHNWLIRELAKWTRYLRDYVETRYYEVHEALTAGHAYPDTVKLYSPSSQRTSGGIGTYEDFAGETDEIAELHTDGCNLYARFQALGAGTKIIAIHPDAPGTALWTKTAGAAIPVMACDGRFIYLHDTSMVGGVMMLDPDTGAEITTHNPVTPVITTPIAICANGWMLAVIEDTLPDIIEVFSMTAAATPVISHAGTVDLTGCTNVRMAMHGNVLYVTYINAATETCVAAYMMDAACALSWVRNLDSEGWGASVATGIACDGERLYLATDSILSIGAVTGSVHALEMTTGRWLWTYPTANDCASIALSSGRVTAGLDDGGGNLFVVTLNSASGAAIRYLSGPDTDTVIAADELGYYMRIATATDEFTRVWRGGPIVEMQVTNPQDPWRAPNPHRAVPVR